YGDNQKVINFYDQLLERAAQQPGIRSAALTSSLPFTGGDFLAFFVEGRTYAPTDRTPDAESRIISPGYFGTMQIPLLRGRLLDDHDAGDAPQVAVINETLARRYFGGEEALGKKITFGDPQAKDSVWYTVVGVVADVRQSRLDKEPYAQVFRSYRQTPRRALTVVLRTEGAPLASVGALREQVLSLDRQQPLYNVRTAEQVMAESIARPRFNTLLIAIFAAVALALAAVGLYGVMSYTVTQRTHELGVRLALGAQPRDLLRLVVRQGMVLVGVGIGLGLIGALAATRLLRSLLFGVSDTDPMTFAGIALLLCLVALAACLVPARRATKVDPLIALRAE
ncbi:MAG: ABC transporter permease, partial [Acidobacteriota bacterium]|nr:ABC transporter permease [Acidobacteriota bacterium]